uniref:Uncharacterized protein n=1 Tax=Kalanchoe fedtschenkoi TaxID=63787 RepID=A0A7N0VHU5_KALFE
MYFAMNCLLFLHAQCGSRLKMSLACFVPGQKGMFREVDDSRYLTSHICLARDMNNPALADAHVLSIFFLLNLQLFITPFFFGIFLSNDSNFYHGIIRNHPLYIL